MNCVICDTILPEDAFEDFDEEVCLHCSSVLNVSEYSGTKSYQKTKKDDIIIYVEDLAEIEETYNHGSFRTNPVFYD